MYWMDTCISIAIPLFIMSNSSLETIFSSMKDIKKDGLKTFSKEYRKTIHSNQNGRRPHEYSPKINILPCIVFQSKGIIQ